MACPYCQQTYPPTPVGFTWWGGLIGPRLLHHARCPSCGKNYNSRTGRPNTTAIAVYISVVFSAVLIIAFAVSAYSR